MTSCLGMGGRNKLLSGVRAKVIRAKHHFRDLNTAISAMFASQQNDSPPGHQYKSDRQELIITLEKGVKINPAVPLIIGDCIHNARSALDHLVGQLAVLNNAPTESISKTSFPVCLEPSEFERAVAKRIAPFISPAALAEIEKLQPSATGNAGKDDVLWVLSQLDIIDKHRLLIVAVTKFRPISFTVTMRAGEHFIQKDITSDNWKRSEDGAEIIRFSFSEDPGKVNVKLNTASRIQIENTGLICDRMPIQVILSDSIQYVKNVVDGFGNLFFDE